MNADFWQYYNSIMSILSAAVSKLLSPFSVFCVCVFTFNYITVKLEQLLESVTCLSMNWLHCGGAEGLENDSHTLYGKQQPFTVSY